MKKVVMARFVSLILLFFGVSFCANSKGKMKAWKELSRPEKCWTFFHPIKAQRVYKCAQRSRFVTDSLEKVGDLHGKNGGQLDAFRHAYWMALMITEGISERIIRKVGAKHEKGNYLDFKKGKFEDSLRSDSMACVMDLRNNDVGITIGKEYLSGDKSISLIRAIIIQVWNGKLFIFLRNAKGDYFDCNDNLIDLKKYDAVWSIPKCLVSSDQITVEH